jgi:hypothetical protein
MRTVPSLFRAGADYRHSNSPSPVDRRRCHAILMPRRDMTARAVAMKDGSSIPRPLFGFAGIWRPWAGIRGTKADPVEGEHKLFSFLTTDPNTIVKPIHEKAMPVILSPDKWQAWLTTSDPMAMQLPLPDDQLHVARVGPKGDSDELQTAYDAEYLRLAGGRMATASLI